MLEWGVIPTKVWYMYRLEGGSDTDTIFLGYMNKKIEYSSNALARKVFRYVDDYLVFIDRSTLDRTVVDTLKVFREYGQGLEFTC